MHGITSSITSAIGDYGLYAVFLLMLVDAVLPAASELVMLYAGATAAGAIAGHDVTLFGSEIHSTGWAYLAMAMAGTLGYTLGSVLGWGIGRVGGRPFLERHGRWVHVTPGRLARAEAWFDRYGPVAVFIGRLVPVVRSLVSIPAGYRRMPLGQFLLLTGLGSALWNGALVSLGWALGENWRQIEEYVGWLQYLVIAAVAFLIVRFVWQRLRARRVIG